MNLILSLRELAAQILPRGHHHEHGDAAQRAAICAGRSENSSGNERDARQGYHQTYQVERPHMGLHCRTSFRSGYAVQRGIDIIRCKRTTFA